VVAKTSNPDNFCIQYPNNEFFGVLQSSLHSPTRTSIKIWPNLCSIRFPYLKPSQVAGMEVSHLPTKLWTLITIAYNIQMMHSLVQSNSLCNLNKTVQKFNHHSSNKWLLKLQTLITFAYNIQTMNSLVCCNPLHLAFRGCWNGGKLSTNKTLNPY